MIISAGHWRGNLGTCDWTLSSVTQADAEVAAPIFDLRKHAPGTEAEQSRGTTVSGKRCS